VDPDSVLKRSHNQYERLDYFNITLNVTSMQSNKN
jgi:uncharacterized protein YpbB